MFIKLQVLLTFFATLTGNSGGPPDLCDLVYTDTGKPILCEPHRDGAPIFDDTVCCEGRSCAPARDGSCATGEPFHCELGEVRTTGEVSCYFEVPDFCNVFPCKPGFQAQPLAEFMCCYEGICWNTYPGANDCEVQDIYWCSSGVTNPDGTTTCLDEA
ncbi:hypothetical protein [Enhygromyxa salina]|uniref:hypothetical protein n=1 Tax=Enhygromyxa salina TaxID=215803 RepID=UPI0011BA62FC|nr:hypothetical protein [Enhygromyxa salina]